MSKKNTKKPQGMPATRAAKRSEVAEGRKVIDQKKYPLFSVCIFCYKNSHLLAEMLNTVFDQTYPRIQLIVSDDGSSNFSVEDVQEYVGKRKKDNIEQVLILQNEENLGTVKHVHKVLQSVEGEYVVITAADDRFSGKDVLEQYVKAFQKKNDAKWLVSRCAITSADYRSIIYYAPTDDDAPYFKSGDAQRLFSRWSRRGMAVPCCMAFRRDAFEVVGGIDLDYQYLEDWPLVLKLLRNGYAPIYLNRATAYHSAGGVTNTNNRYGIAVRKAFYDDKYLLFRKEVDPYQELISPEDQRLRKQYIKEIMNRNYFLDIEYQAPSKAGKLKAALKRPRNFLWAFEVEYMKHKDKVQRKKMIAISQLLLLLSCVFIQFDGALALEIVFRIMGGIDMLAGLFLLFCGFATYPLERYYEKKVQKRRKLVM